MPTLGDLTDFSKLISEIKDYSGALELEKSFKDSIAPGPEEDSSALREDNDTARLRQSQTGMYKNNYRIVSMVGYLIGVRKTLFESEQNPAMRNDIYKKMNIDKNARIIRNLCIVRTCFERNYGNIYKKLNSGPYNIDTIPELVDAEAMKGLFDDGIILAKHHHDARKYVSEINLLINARIYNVKHYFPEWLSWDYIKDFFIMPNGTTQNGAIEAFDIYNEDWNKYPYQCYCNWNWYRFTEEEISSIGNILWSDAYFVPLLYKSHGAEFTMMGLLHEATDKSKDQITNFIASSDRTLIVVDCENSNPVKLAAVLGTLNDDVKNKIQNVLLFDSAYTTDGWRILSETSRNIEKDNVVSADIKDNFDWHVPELISGLTMTRINVDRLIETKSQVDMLLAIETVKQVMIEKIDSVILVSSDSDYWTLIRSLPDARFMVMFEKEKTSPKIESVLMDSGISYCFMDNFNTEVAYQLRNVTVKNYIQNYLDKYRFNAGHLLDQAVFNSWIEMDESEKKAFFNKYLKKAHVEIDEDKNFRIVLGEK